MNEFTSKDIKIELSHSDGRKMHGKDRHILAKVYFYQDKMDVIKNVKQAQRGNSVYVIDDLTPLDLKEKKIYIEHVSYLYSTGVKLRLYNGRRRLNSGKP